MARSDSDYVSIFKNVRNNGFFSEYLPPCFRLDPQVFNYSPPCSCDLIPPYSFTMSRFNENDARRTISIPEIGAYASVSEFIKNNHILKSLLEFIETNTVSFSPILDENNSIIRHEQSYFLSNSNSISSNFIENLSTKIKKARGAKKILKLDISNCFSSFYTHMIPSIILGLDDASNQYRHSLSNSDQCPSQEYTRFQEFDASYRRLNLNQTNGILTGPLYSRIISEAMLARIDLDLTREHYTYSRYVDDYEVYLKDESEQNVISSFSRILKKYGFSLNYEKIEVIDFPYYISNNLEKLFNSTKDQILPDTEDALSSFMNLFNQFFILESSGVKGSIRFLLKSLESSLPSFENKIIDRELYRSYLMTIISNNDRSLVKACSLLISDGRNSTLNQNDILFLEELLKKHLYYGNDLEVIWILYTLIELNISITQELKTSILNSENELAQLLLLRKDILSESEILALASKATSWLLVYELFSSSTINEIANSNFIRNKLCLDKNLNMYEKMKIHHIHFCYS